MTVISKVKDPISKKEVILAEGIVKLINLKPYDPVKVSYIKKGGSTSTIESTHKASILLTNSGVDEWVNLGDIKSQRGNLQIKEDERWIDILEGMEVSMVVTPNDYNGKTYYNSSKSKINILNTNGVTAQKPAPVQQSAPTNTGTTKIYGSVTSLDGEVALVLDEKQGSVTVKLGEHVEGVEVGVRITAFINSSGEVTGGFKLYDKTTTASKGKENYGMLAGGAGNVAVNLITSLDEFKEVSLKAFDVVEKVKVWAKETYPNLDAYNIGNRAGQSVGVASKFSTFKTLYEDSLKVFAILCEVEDHIKTVKESPVTVQESKSKGKEKPSKKEEKEVVEVESNLDFDDDIPF